MISAGVFVVPKPGGKQRLIIDRRWNSLETDLVTALGRRERAPDSEGVREVRRLTRLPGGSLFGDVILGPSDRPIVQLHDFHVYYFTQWPMAPWALP